MGTCWLCSRLPGKDASLAPKNIDTNNGWDGNDEAAVLFLPSSSSPGDEPKIVGRTSSACRVLYPEYPRDRISARRLYALASKPTHPGDSPMLNPNWVLLLLHVDLCKKMWVDTVDVMYHENILFWQNDGATLQLDVTHMLSPNNTIVGLAFSIILIICFPLSIYLYLFLTYESLWLSRQIIERTVFLWFDLPSFRNQCLRRLDEYWIWPSRAKIRIRDYCNEIEILLSTHMKWKIRSLMFPTTSRFAHSKAAATRSPTMERALKTEI